MLFVRKQSLNMKAIKMRSLLVLMVSIGISLCSFQARADEPKPLGVHGAWQAFVFNEGGEKVCYMASQPTTAKGDYSSRGDVFALITHRPAEGTRNVFSYITGYDYKPGSDATVKIDGDSFLLFTQDDTAWAPDADTDNKLTDYIKKGSNMVVTGTSSRGTLTTDTFSLRGSGAAYDAISRECN